MNNIKLWHVISGVIFGGWILATASVESMGGALSNISAFQRLFQPGFIGMIIGYSMAPFSVACVIFIIANLIPSLKMYANLCAFIGIISVVLIMLVGNSSLSNHQPTVSANNIKTANELKSPDIYAPAKVCHGYKIDPLIFLRIGSVVHIKAGGELCRTIESHEEFYHILLSKHPQPAYTLEKLGVCLKVPSEGIIVRILQIVEVSGGCLMQVKSNDMPEKGNFWTDVSMTDEVLQ